MDGRFVVLSVSLVVLAVFIAEPGTGVMAQDDGEISDRPPIPKPGQTHCSQSSCQNFAVESITGISDQIQMELKASHIYMAMAAYFGRDDVAYRGFAKFFMKSSHEEREHAMKLVEYLNKRGGIFIPKVIEAPENTYGTPLEAVDDALALERDVNSALLDLHWVAQEKNDPHLQDFLETEFLQEQVDSIQELASWAKILTRLGDDKLGIHQFDEELFHGKRG